MTMATTGNTTSGMTTTATVNTNEDDDEDNEDDEEDDDDHNFGRPFPTKRIAHSHKRCRSECPPHPQALARSGFYTKVVFASFRWLDVGWTFLRFILLTRQLASIPIHSSSSHSCSS